MFAPYRIFIGIAVTGLSVFGALGGAGNVYAAEVVTGAEYTLEHSATTSQNIYIAAEEITLAGTVVGDALMLGENIDFTGTTTEDFMMLGKDISLAGVIVGDTRFIAADAHIDGSFTGDLMVVAGSALFRSDFRGSGDTRVYASHVVFRGYNAQDVVLRGGTVEINGEVEGDVIVTFHEHLLIGDEARISGSVFYEGPREPVVSEGAVISGELDGELVSRSVRGEMYIAELGEVFTGAQVLFALSSAFASVLFVLLFPRFSNRAVQYVVRRGVPSIGYGFLFIVLGLALTIVLLLSVFGLYIGLLGLVGLATVAMLTSLLTPALAGALIAQWVVKEPRVTWYWVIAGVIALELLLWIPILGPVIRILMYLAVAGSLARGMYDVWWTRRKEEM